MTDATDGGGMVMIYTVLLHWHLYRMATDGKHYCVYCGESLS
jgi:hypothetical protein